MSSIQSKNRRVLFALGSFVGIAFLFPFYYMKQHNQSPESKGNVHSKSSLSRTQQIRGAYINTGSKDVGYDDTFYKKHQQQLLKAEEINQVNKE